MSKSQTNVGDEINHVDADISSSNLPFPAPSTPANDAIPTSFSASAKVAQNTGKTLVWIEGNDIPCNANPRNKPGHSIRPIVEGM